MSKEEQCLKWLKNKSINPKTGRKIKVGGPTYKKLEQQCEIFLKSKTPSKNKRKIKTVKKKTIILPANLITSPITPKSLKHIEQKNLKKPSLEKQKEKSFVINTTTNKVNLPHSIDLIVSDKMSKIDPIIKLDINELISIFYIIKKHGEKLNIANKDLIIETMKTYKGGLFPRPELFLMINVNKSDLYKPIDPMFMFSLRNAEQRFSFLPLIIWIDRLQLNHFNILIYDKLVDAFYRFEPQGGKTKLYSHKKLDLVLKKYLSQFGYDYKSIAGLCPLIGPQKRENIKEKIPQDPGGFCSFWSIIFIDFILSNQNKSQFKNKPISEFMTAFLKNIRTKFGSYKRYIRSYATYLNNIMLKLYTSNFSDFEKAIKIILKQNV
jgi:hypothetical protein